MAYIGEFVVDRADPYSWEDAPETGDGPIRQVVVFHLAPKGQTVHDEHDTRSLPAPSEGVASVPFETVNAETYVVSPRAQDITAERREHLLVDKFLVSLRAKGISVERHRYLPPGETKPLYCDVFDSSRKNLIEAKGTGAREAIRLAIGQLSDYRRFEPEGTRLAVLLERRARPDLERLLTAQGIAMIWKTEEGSFTDNAEGRFV